MTKQTIPVSAEDSLTIDRVGGDLTVQGWDQQELQASGDVIHVQREERLLSITSGGNLSLSIPRGMRVSIGGIGGDVTIQDLSGPVVIGLVGGDANLRNLTGPVQLNGLIGGETHMENVAKISMGAGSRGPDLDIGDRVRRKIEHATERAEKQLRRAHADRQAAVNSVNRLRTAKFGVKFDSSRWKYNRDSDNASTAPAGEPVAEEERMMILRMLQEKKITSEEADKLLSALEGNA